MQRVVLGLLLALLLEGHANAKIVSFSVVHRAGFGDGGNPPTTSTAGFNGLPACSKGSVHHLTASVPAQGFVEVSSGPAPQSIMEVRPFLYGAAGPTGPSPTFSKPGIPGENGAARFYKSTCTVKPQEGWDISPTSRRDAYSSFAWPAELTVTSGNAVGTAPQAHRLAASAGPGDFVFNAPGGEHTLSGTAGPNRFGGGFRASQSATLVLSGWHNAGVATGTLHTGPNLRGHGRSVPTQVVSNTATFFVQGVPIPVTLQIWQMPFTTGRVVAQNSASPFTTNRTATGFDNRTPMGEHGTLQLVSPWTASIKGLSWPGGYSGMTTLEFQFLPEPSANRTLAVGVALVLGLSGLARRIGRS